MHDEADFRGDRDEGCGRNHAALWIVPANERLEPDHFAADLRLRLVIEVEFIPRDGGTEFMLNRAPLAQPVIHFDLEEARRAATGGLGAVERCVGIVEQRRRVRAVVWKDRNTDADADAKMLAINYHVVRDGFEQASGGGVGVRGLTAIWCDENEFVAPEAGQERVAGEFSKHPRKFTQ